jgi:SAM-dependent methyltransferase
MSCVRFRFGENWRSFLAVLDDERIAEARRSLEDMLEVDSLEGRSFLDVGSGSGLFSLAAWQLGAARVRSLDVDPDSVACTEELRRRFAGDAGNWEIERADVLAAALGEFDVVYAWGVLHHTGDLRAAMERAGRAVAPGGRLFVSIYNDQGRKSAAWRRIKRLYNLLPRPLRAPFVVALMAPIELLVAIRHGPRAYLRRWRDYPRSRGMSRWHDMVDWCGGYPFEVARPEAVTGFYAERGFALVRSRLDGGSGCNEFVFARSG